MKIYTCTDHEGHWPVGVCSVIVANSEEEAAKLLAIELHKHGLHKNKPFTLQELDTTSPRAFVLRDGDY
jgi:hypothetical protein